MGTLTEKAVLDLNGRNKSSLLPYRAYHDVYDVPPIGFPYALAC